MQCGHNLLRARNAAVRTPSGSGAAPQSGSIRGYPLRPVSPPTAAESRVAGRVYAPAYKHPLRAPLGCDSARLKFRAGSASRSPEAAHLNVDYHELTNGRWGYSEYSEQAKALAACAAQSATRKPQHPAMQPGEAQPHQCSHTHTHTHRHTHARTRTHTRARTCSRARTHKHQACAHTARREGLQMGPRRGMRCGWRCAHRLC
jgi:hypothetical protein